MGRGARAAAVAVPLLLASTACGPVGTDVAAPPTSPSARAGEPGPAAEVLEASAVVLGLERPRYLSERGELEVTVTSRAGEDLHVVGAGLTSPAFPGAAPARTDTVLAPGARTDFRVTPGPADCDAVVDAGVVDLHVDVAGPPRRATQAVDAQVLRDLFAEECAAERLARVVDVAWSPDGWQDTGERALAGDLVLTRVPGAERPDVEVVDAQGSVLVRLGLDLPLRLDADDDATSLPVRLVPARCDGHALGEAKRVFDWYLRVRLDGEELLVEADAAGQEDVLRDWLSRTCSVESG